MRFIGVITVYDHYMTLSTHIYVYLFTYIAFTSETLHADAESFLSHMDVTQQTHTV